MVQAILRGRTGTSFFGHALYTPTVSASAVTKNPYTSFFFSFLFRAYNSNNDLGIGHFLGINDKVGLMVLNCTLSHQLLSNGY